MKMISKSKLTTFVQCPLALWLQENNPGAWDDQYSEPALLDAGNEVGDLARRYFGEEFELVDNSNGMAAAAEQTQRFLKGDCPVVCEATFRAGNLQCMVDVLTPAPGCTWADRKVVLTEVKASTAVKDYHVYDAVFQKIVVERCGYTVECTQLMHLNPEYVRDGELDLNELFAIEEISDAQIESYGRDILELLPLIERVRELEDEPSPEELHKIMGSFESRMLAEHEARNAERKAEGQRKLPDLDFGYPGKRCSNPHKCGFFGHCLVDKLEDKAICSMAGQSRNALIKSVRDGVLDLEVWAGRKRAELETKRRRSPGTEQGIALSQAQSMMAGGKPVVDIEGLCRHLAPYEGRVLYHLDFETVQPPIPLYDGTSPWQQLPTQYSLHIQHLDGTLEHREFLGKEGTDPRRELCEHMLADIPRNGLMVSWNKAFEISRIREMALAFPDLREDLMALARTKSPSRVEKDDPRALEKGELNALAKRFAAELGEGCEDLMVPFKNGTVYLPAQAGSYSIKYVLPALFPNDPELDYHNPDNLVSHGKELGVPDIRKGDQAANAFLHLADEGHSPEWIEAMRKNLLQYCCLDTLAMVRVLERLREWLAIADDQGKEALLTHIEALNA